LHFEQEKRKIEQRYRGLVENSVKDALFYQKQNKRLQIKLQQLKLSKK